MAKKKPIGKTKKGKELFQPTKEEYATIQNIVEIHAEYLMESIAKSVAVLETRIEISEAMGENKESHILYWCIEQTKVYMDILYRSIEEVEEWCGVKAEVAEIDDVEAVDAKKSKRIKRIPVTDKVKEEPRKQTKTIKGSKGTLRKPRPKIDAKAKAIEALKKKRGDDKK